MFSQIKERKHIEQNFHSVAKVMPRGGTSGCWGCPGGSKKNFFQTWSCGISNRRGWQAEENASKMFILGSNWWPWGEVKRSNIINMSISKIFIPNFVCVLTNKRKKTYWTEFSFCCQGHAPGWDFGVLGESKTLAWGFAMAPHRLRALVSVKTGHGQLRLIIYIVCFSIYGHGCHLGQVT